MSGYGEFVLDMVAVQTLLATSADELLRRVGFVDSDQLFEILVSPDLATLHGTLCAAIGGDRARAQQARERLARELQTRKDREQEAMQTAMSILGEAREQHRREQRQRQRSDLQASHVD